MIIKTCKHHGPLYLKDVIKSGKKYDGSQNYKCIKCHKIIRDNNYKKNKEKILAKNKKYWMEDIEKRKKIKHDSWIKNKHKYREKQNASRSKWDKNNRPRANQKKERYRKVAREELKDSYIKTLLTNGSTLTAKDIPDSLVKAVRAIRQLKRGVKEILEFDKLTVIEDKIDGNK